MSNSKTNISITYFGKIPSRGDFVKAGTSLSLLTSLDNWLARTMDSMSEDARWKSIYDQVKPFHFAFLGSCSTMAIAGHFTASSDAAQRRFPFVAAGAMEVSDAATFTARSPLVLSRLWNRLAQLSAGVTMGTDSTPDLNVISESQVQVDLSSQAYEANFSDFLDMQTIGSIDHQLQQAGFTGTCRQLILGLGLLLQPVMASGSNRLEKSLSLPLPADPMYQYLTASFWLALINPFLQRADFELSIYITQLKQAPALVVGFSGASSITLRAVLSPKAAEDNFISFENGVWVEDAVAADYGVAKLSTYLDQPELSLAVAKQYFEEVFLGA